MHSQPLSENFQQGLLHLVHLLTIADGKVDKREIDAVQRIIEDEKIPEDTVESFRKKVLIKTEKELYHDGLAYLSQCLDDEKLQAFVYLYRLSEADDQVHVREVRLLLYSLKSANIEFEEVERLARKKAAST